MLVPTMDVTVEVEAFDKDNHQGRNATIVAVVGPFAVIDIENVGIRGCLVDCLQPRLKPHNMTALMDLRERESEA